MSKARDYSIGVFTPKTFLLEAFPRSVEVLGFLRVKESRSAVGNGGPVDAGAK